MGRLLDPNEPDQIDLVAYRGLTFRLLLQYTADGVPVDMTDYDGQMELRRDRMDAAPAATATFSIDAAVTGEFQFSLAADTIATLTDPEFLYSAWLLPPGGADPIYMCTGKIIFART